MRAAGAPRWRLDTIYRGFDSEGYRNAISTLGEEITALREAVDSQGAWLQRALERLNDATTLAETLESFAYATYSTDTGESQALKELDQLNELIVGLRDGRVRLRSRLAREADSLRKLWHSGGELEAYAEILEEEISFAGYQMGVEEENLGADLNRSGGELWSRLQESVSSELSTLWDRERGERKSVTELRALAFDRDRAVRERAYQEELKLWKSMETPLAHALNGVKGFAATINKRRGHRSDLERAVMQSRLSRKGLDAMIGVMEESLPLFRSYLREKAKLLGLERVAFFDLFAPVGGEEKSWSWDEAKAFILDRFGRFSSDLAALAEKAFTEEWIDGQPRQGKVGGAYCTSLPAFGESRILANFDGSFSAVSTLAHELGHAYHFEVIKEEPALLREYPMTLAETASIFCETHIFYTRVEEEGDNPLPILEHFLQESTQVIVDILSRFYFEKSLFAERESGFVSPGRLKELMLDAQERTYGDGMDRDLRHPYMWAVKGHYYRPELGFYNFPYAFGQLFGLGLYAQYLEDPKGFPRRYRELLKLTGAASAQEVAGSAGFDLESPEFWRSGISLIRSFEERFRRAVAARLE
ncbi:MAG: M3 family oligoendopeptidase [Spirochaetaceae bacterium]